MRHGRADVVVAQVLLDDAQVAAGAHQQLDATRMAEGMRVKLGDPGTPA